jgi:hypothetical protein
MLIPLLLKASFLFGNVAYGPPAQVWIDIKDPTWFSGNGELNGSLQYYTDVNHWVRIQCTTSYIPAPPLPPIPIYTVYNFSFSDSAVTYLWAGGNTLLVHTDRANIVFVSGFEEGQNAP